MTGDSLNSTEIEWVTVPCGGCGESVTVPERIEERQKNSEIGRVYHGDCGPEFNYD